MSRRFGIVVLVLFAMVTAVLQAGAQATGMRSIGWLEFDDGTGTRSRAFDKDVAQGLHDLGYVEDQNLVIHRRFGDRDALARLAGELV